MDISEQANLQNSETSSSAVENIRKEPFKTGSQREDHQPEKLAQTAPFPFPTADNHDPLPQIEHPTLQNTSEEALDAGVEESFPASDPVSVTVTKVVSVVQAKSRL